MNNLFASIVALGEREKLRACAPITENEKRLSTLFWRELSQIEAEAASIKKQYIKQLANIKNLIKQSKDLKNRLYRVQMNTAAPFIKKNFSGTIP